MRPASQASVGNDQPHALHEQLEVVRDLVKRGEFGDDLLEEVGRLEKVLAATAKIQTEDQFSYLKSKCFIAELYDYFGDFQRSRAAAEGGAHVVESITGTVGKALSLEDKGIVREKIRLRLAYAHAFLYRSHKYHDAKREILHCHNLIEKLKEPDFPCNGTLAQILYYLGRVQRQTGEYTKAEHSFAEALRYYNQRAEQRKKHYEEMDLPPDKRRELLGRELQYLRHRSAVCLALGLGWVRYTKGHLTQALALILPARIVLLSTNDVLNVAYVDLIYGSIRRSLAGRTPERLEDAIDYVERAAVEFEKHRHDAYRARAAYELSLAFMYCNKYDEAKRQLKYVDQYSNATNDHRWLAKARVIYSRIACEQGDLLGAEQQASSALEEARQHRHDTVEIDALFARGEVRRRIGSARYEDALQDIKEALRIHEQTGARSPKVEGVCRLYLARLYALLNDPHSANGQMDRWKQLEQMVEHRNVHQLAAVTAREVDRLTEHLIVRSDDPDLDYDAHRQRLQTWLVTQARRRVNSNEKVAKLLGISRQTLHKWSKGQ